MKFDFFGNVQAVAQMAPQQSDSNAHLLPQKETALPLSYATKPLPKRPPDTLPRFDFFWKCGRVGGRGAARAPESLLLIQMGPFLPGTETPNLLMMND